MPMIDFSVARQWQIEAFNRFESNGFRGIVEVATGGGKTVFALMCFAELHRRNSLSTLVVVVPTVALADQWLVNFEVDLGLSADEIALLSSRSTAGDFRTANVVVLNSARALEVSPEARATALLVVDECHRAGSDQNALALRGHWGSTLGLSATPERQYDDGSKRHLYPALGEKIYSYSVAQALGDGVLSPFDLFNVEVPLLEEERLEYEKVTRQIGIAIARGLAEEDVQMLLRRRARLSNSAVFRIPVTARILSENRGLRTLVFHESIEAAKEIFSMLRDQNHSVALYHSGLSDSVRRDNLKMFRLGVVDVLVTCRALDEGANIPETCLAVVAAATASHRQRIQRLGRVLRPSPGKERAVIYSLFATEIEKRRLAEEEASLDGLVSVRWRKVSENE